MIPLDRLQQIIPPDQALANKALATSLQQIGGISNLTLPQLSAVTGAIQTTKDLPAITALTEAVPPAVANYYTSTLANGGGSNGDIRPVDIIGLAGGWVATDAFTRTVEIYSTMDLSYLTLIYQTMVNALTGVYGDPELGPVVIPVGRPAAGTYLPVTIPNPTPPPPDIVSETAAQVAVAALSSAAITEINNLISTYPTQTTELNTLWTDMAQQLSSENTLQPLANIDYANYTANDRSSIYGFIFSLPDYGLQIQEGGMSWLIEAMADLTTQGGQATVACLRQGRNQTVLNNAGIVLSSNIPSDPVPPPPDAVLIPSEYSAAEAANLVIK